MLGSLSDMNLVEQPSAKNAISGSGYDIREITRWVKTRNGGRCLESET